MNLKLYIAIFVVTCCKSMNAPKSEVPIAIPSDPFIKLAEKTKQAFKVFDSTSEKPEALALLAQEIAAKPSEDLAVDLKSVYLDEAANDFLPYLGSAASSTQTDEQQTPLSRLVIAGIPIMTFAFLATMDSIYRLQPAIREMEISGQKVKSSDRFHYIHGKNDREFLVDITSGSPRLVYGKIEGKIYPVILYFGRPMIEVDNKLIHVQSIDRNPIFDSSGNAQPLYGKSALNPKEKIFVSDRGAYNPQGMQYVLDFKSGEYYPNRKIAYKGDLYEVFFTTEGFGYIGVKGNPRKDKIVDMANGKVLEIDVEGSKIEAEWDYSKVTIRYKNKDLYVAKGQVYSLEGALVQANWTGMPFIEVPDSTGKWVQYPVKISEGQASFYTMEYEGAEYRVSTSKSTYTDGIETPKGFIAVSIVGDKAVLYIPNVSGSNVEKVPAPLIEKTPWHVRYRNVSLSVAGLIGGLIMTIIGAQETLKLNGEITPLQKLLEDFGKIVEERRLLMEAAQSSF